MRTENLGEIRKRSREKKQRKKEEKKILISHRKEGRPTNEFVSEGGKKGEKIGHQKETGLHEDSMSFEKKLKSKPGQSLGDK